MGSLGYNETIWKISNECALSKIGCGKKCVCCVCREKIRTATCFKIDELHYCCNEVKPKEYNKCYCWNCAKQLLIEKVVVSR